MIPDSVLGMPLDEALALARRSGMGEIRISQTQAPRDQRSGGTLRVIRVREDEWTVAAFLDETPRE